MKKSVKVKTAVEAQEIVEREAKENAVSSIRRVEKMKVGKVVRQGDIYIHRVDDGHQKGVLASGRQLVRGRSTGSRHVAEAPAEVYAGKLAPPWCNNRGLMMFLGPCIVSPDRFVITHPEHAHVDLPAGTYQITYQADARTNAQVVD